MRQSAVDADASKDSWFTMTTLASGARPSSEDDTSSSAMLAAPRAARAKTTPASQPCNAPRNRKGQPDSEARVKAAEAVSAGLTSETYIVTRVGNRSTAVLLLRSSPHCPAMDELDDVYSDDSNEFELPSPEPKKKAETFAGAVCFLLASITRCNAACWNS